MPSVTQRFPSAARHGPPARCSNLPPGSVFVGAHGCPPVPLQTFAHFPVGKRSGKWLGGSPKPPPKRAAPSLDSPAGAGTSPWGRLQFPFRRDARLCARPRSRCPPTSLAESGADAPDRRGARLCARPRSAQSRPEWEQLEDWVRSQVQRLIQELLEEEVTGKGEVGAESGADRVGWVPPSPHQRGLRPLWTLPPERAPRPGGGSSSRFVGAHGCAPVPAPDVRPLPCREAERKVVVGFPQAPPKREVPSLDSPAGAGTSSWGRLQFPFCRGAPTPRRGAPVPAPDVRPLPCREADRIGVRIGGGGGTPKPHQRGLRPLWTLPPGGKPLRGSGCDVQRLRCLAALKQRRSRCVVTRSRT